MSLAIPSFADVRVLAVGDPVLDRYWHGATTRISREAPVPVVRVRDVEQRPGGAANAAVNVAALGARVTLLGYTGDDPEADALAKLLEGQGVDFRPLRLGGHATVAKLRVMSQHQQLIRLDFDGGFHGAPGTALVEDFARLLPGAGAVMLSDYGHGVLAAVPDLIARGGDAGVPVLVDPRGPDFERYRGATVLTPNVAEFESFAGPCPDLPTLVERGEAACEALELSALLITRSAQGMTLLQAGQAALHLPAHAREVYDVTGAGDTVIAILAAAVAAGAALADATALANLGAGLVVAKLGTATVTVPELENATREPARFGSGVLAEGDVIEAVAAARARAERVIMTNGCFDILHAGHVNYLAKARALGDRLVVAVNDDASVERLKGRGRPVNALDKRMAVLAALESVDWVVPFSEDTPERLICTLRPDVLVKGGDYRGASDLPGAACVEAGGGEVRILDFEQGCSTSGIIDAIHRSADRATTRR